MVRRESRDHQIAEQKIDAFGRIIIDYCRVSESKGQGAIGARRRAKYRMKGSAGGLMVWEPFEVDEYVTDYLQMNKMHGRFSDHVAG